MNGWEGGREGEEGGREGGRGVIDAKREWLVAGTYSDLHLVLQYQTGVLLDPS